MTSAIEDALHQMLQRSAGNVLPPTDPLTEHARRLRLVRQRRRSAKVLGAAVAVAALVAVPVTAQDHRQQRVRTEAPAAPGAISEARTADEAAMLAACRQFRDGETASWRVLLAVRLPATTQQVVQGGGASVQVPVEDFALAAQETTGQRRTASCTLQKTAGGVFAPLDASEGALWLGPDWLPGEVVPAVRLGAGSSSVVIGYYGASVARVTSTPRYPTIMRGGVFVVVTPRDARPTETIPTSRAPGDGGPALPTPPPPRTVHLPPLVLRGVRADGSRTAAVPWNAYPITAHACWHTPDGRPLEVVRMLLGVMGGGQPARARTCGVAVRRAQP